MQRATITLLGICLAATLAALPSPSRAACVELKNDNFVEGQSAGVTAVRSFCISEYYGTIFKADQDLTVQKIRLLLSGDGKNVMQTTTLKMSIYKEKAPGSAEPGAVISSEVPYQPGTKTKPTPEWMEIDDTTFAVKQGESFRVVFGHGNIDCELRVTGKPLCAEPCQWWSATVDGGPVKPNTNVVEGSMIQCPALKDRKWRFWKDLPASCRRLQRRRRPPTMHRRRHPTVRLRRRRQRQPDLRRRQVGPLPKLQQHGLHQRRHPTMHLQRRQERLPDLRRRCLGRLQVRRRSAQSLHPRRHPKVRLHQRRGRPELQVRWLGLGGLSVRRRPAQSLHPRQHPKLQVRRRRRRHPNL